MENKATIQDYVKLHAVILVWGFTGILGKVISIPSVSIVWYRTLIAFVSLLVFLILKKKVVQIPKALLYRYLGTGVIVALHWFFFFEALKVSTVSVTLATLASATLFTSLLEPLFFKKKIVAYEIIFGFIVIAGLLMIFQFETKYRLGIIYSLISAFCASLFTTLNGIFVAKGGSPIRITMYEMLGSVAVITGYLFFVGDFNIETIGLLNNGWETFWLDSIYLIILGIICTSIAFVVSVEVMKKLSPFTVSISINMEPIYAIILALLFFGEKEQMSTGFYIGAALVMSTIFGNGILKRISKRKLND
ncbi:MAG: DMT family transporter [Salibacteraceae bacterium]